MSTDFHNFWQTHITENIQNFLKWYTINPPNVFCVTALSSKIVIAILVMLFKDKNASVLFWQYLCHFSSKFRIF